MGSKIMKFTIYTIIVVVSLGIIAQTYAATSIDGNNIASGSITSTGPLSSSGAFSVSNVFSVDPVAKSVNFNDAYMKFSAANTGASTEYWLGRDSDNMYFNIPANKSFIFRLNNSNIMTIAPTTVGIANRELTSVNGIKGDTAVNSIELRGFDRDSNSNTVGQSVLVTGGDGGSLTTGASGGSVTLQGGAGGGSGNNNGGNVLLVPGVGVNSGTNGVITMKQSNASRSDGINIFPSKEVSTTDATQTTAMSLTLEDENTYHVEALVTAVQSTGANRASYRLAGTVYRTGGGSATLQGTVTAVHSQESDANWDATLTVSGNDLRVSVTGVASTTIRWVASMQYLNTSN